MTVRRQVRAPRLTVPARAAVWLVGSSLGAWIIALPDSDERVFSLSRTHGPSAVDLVGVGVLLVAWTPVAAVLWSSRRRLSGRRGRAAVFLAVVGLAWLVVTVAADVEGAWVGGVVLLTAAQVGALWHLWRADRRGR